MTAGATKKALLIQAPYTAVVSHKSACLCVGTNGYVRVRVCVFSRVSACVCVCICIGSDETSLLSALACHSQWLAFITEVWDSVGPSAGQNKHTSSMVGAYTLLCAQMQYMSSLRVDCCYSMMSALILVCAVYVPHAVHTTSAPPRSLQPLHTHHPPSRRCAALQAYHTHPPCRGSNTSAGH